MTLVRIVMAPTAISPPYFSREELKHTEMILSLACMINVASPRATQGRIISGFRMRFFFRMCRIVFFPQRKERTQMQETACDRIVASAAPLTPRWNAKINSGSRTMFITAPIRTESIPVLAKPCVVINIFMPRVSWTKIVPTA